ncbi:Hsp70 family protein [Actinokineospora auranticolor]|uniref:Hsp70 protein n=1 Tax=Actinokineospora auranticolor TaxID=155976 RepID=A0A2S6GFX0_9PSEU|nr:Hsp70 family protein [Actinokineospora auranticolor]PPK64046.1 Hsp70 protein [Actinokineospora auranticolor]
MPYVLGVDVGRTRGAAAVCRRAPGGRGPAEVVALDAGARWVPAVIGLAPDGAVLVGRAADKLAASRPDLVARAVVDRVGDDTAILLGGDLYPAETLLAALVTWIVDVVAEAEGGPPERLAVTHPPEWGNLRRGLLRDALRDAGFPGAVLIPTVVAAAEAHHAVARLAAGEELVVALFGGHLVEHAVLRRTPAAFDLVAHHVTPDAGAAVDDVLARHVLAAAEHAERHDHTVPDLAAAAGPALLRTACATAKERLSTATEVRVPVPHLRTDVTVTRARFDELVHPLLVPAITATRTLLARAPAEATAVLAGGTARIPLVAALADSPVLDDPATAPARGAALAVSPREPAEPPRLGPAGPLVRDPESAPGLVPVDQAGPTPAPMSTMDVSDEPPPRPPVRITPLRPPRGRFARQGPPAWLPRPRRPRHDEDRDTP